jgi:zinc/manganese transport system substrate-binding protein/zinc transport system substrate-binding protein
MKRKQKLLEISLLLVIVLLVIASINVDAQDSNEEIKIICTNSALADFISNIITENSTIDYIMPAGVCPAHFDTTPGDIDKIVNADVIISLGWEPWLEDLINKSENLEYSEIKCVGLGEWNIPTGAVKYIQKIRDGLLLILPEYNTIIQQNADNYLQEINDTAERIKQQIKNQGLKNRKVVCIEWYKDFLNYFGFNVSYYYGTPEGLSVQDEINVINAVSNEDVSAVIDNLQSGTTFGAKVASETGKSHIILTNFPNAIPGTESYLKTIQYNINQTITGIQTYDYKKGDIQNLENQIDEITLQRNTSIAISGILIVLVLILFIMFNRK